MQPKKAWLPLVSILGKCSKQIRAAYHSVDQQLEPCLTEVNRLLSHHPDNPAPSIPLFLILQRVFNALPISSSRSWEDSRTRIPSPNCIQSHRLVSSTASSNLPQTSYKKGYRNLALAPPEAAHLLKQINRAAHALL